MEIIKPVMFFFLKVKKKKKKTQVSSPTTVSSEMLTFKGLYENVKAPFPRRAEVPKANSEQKSHSSQSRQGSVKNEAANSC